MNAFNVFFPLMSTLSGILEIRDCKYRKYGTGDDELNPPPAPCCWSNPFKDLLFRGLLHLVQWPVSGLGDNIALRVKWSIALVQLCWASGWLTIPTFLPL